MLFLFPSKLRKKIQAHQPIHLFAQFTAWVFALYWVSVAAIMLIEPFTFTQANLLIWQTFLTIGYGNKLPDTDGGLWFMMASGLFGVALVSALIGSSIAVFTYYLDLKKGGFMKNPHKNGYVVFNFPGEGNMLELIRQLRITEPNVPVCIVDNRLDELPLQLRSMVHVHFIRGELTRPEVYARAALEHQQAVAVLPIDRNDPNSDAATASAVRMILRYLEQSQSQTRVQHMLVDPDNAVMFDGMASQEITKRADILMLVQEFQGAGTAQVIELLLRNDEGDDLKMFPAYLVVGMTWKALRHRVTELADDDVMDFTVLALKRGSEKPVTRPKKKEVIQSGDLLCIVADDSFDWRAAEEAITGKRHQPDLAEFSAYGMIGH